VIVETQHGQRWFIERHRMRAVLAIEDEVRYGRAVALLVEEEYIRPHRRKTSPARGFVLGADWDGGHELHLRRIARNLLADHGLAETLTRGRIIGDWF
jgi:hypothetical protein